MERTSVVRGIMPGGRSVKSVPFVELAGGRVQGVVSSGSDIERVYVAFFEAGSGDYYCVTNNNRPCGGLRGSPCKHIAELIDEAILQFGSTRVGEYFGVEAATWDARTIFASVRGREKKESPGVLFSRFLDYLRHCEIPPSSGTVLEMGWFVS